jgi:hypothetical protein
LDVYISLEDFYLGIERKDCINQQKFEKKSFKSTCWCGFVNCSIKKTKRKLLVTDCTIGEIYNLGFSDLVIYSVEASNIN